MKLYINERESAKNCIALEDMVLTKDLPTTAGSKMLDGYVSLFEATATEKLADAGFELGGKVNVGEFGIDLLGETSYFGAVEDGEKLVSASAEVLKKGEAAAVMGVDVNGAQRRAAAQSGLVYIKPTYGTVSRFGVIPAACSGDTVGIMAISAETLQKVLDAVAGHDDKDGTSLPEEKCALLKSGANVAPVKKVALITDFMQGCDDEVKKTVCAFKDFLRANGVEVDKIECSVLLNAKAAWNILMCSELCNNVSRYDGVKYGYRAPEYKNIDELYTLSRTQAFGDMLKTAILYGSDCLASDNYDKVYDKALRIRRVIAEAFEAVFENYDAVLMPAASKAAYTAADVKSDKYLVFEEDRFTAPASITGLPTVVVGGVQLVGKVFSEKALIDIAKMYEKEAK